MATITANCIASVAAMLLLYVLVRLAKGRKYYSLVAISLDTWLLLVIVLVIIALFILRQVQ